VRAKYFCRAGLVAALNVAMIVVPFASAGAQSGMKPVRPVAEVKFVSSGETAGVLAGIIGGAVVTVIVVILLIHRSHRTDKSRTITGCVRSADNGMSLTDEGDKQLYALSGNTSGIKAGERMTLHGKKINSDDANKPLGWKTDSIVKDFGACQP
jgi:mannitol-specific phosphotransferase system IIBC component